MARPSSLPAPSTELVFNELKRSEKPVTAYGLLKKLESAGIKSPPIVYRALEALQKQGKVHKVERLNAFVPCRGVHDGPYDMVVLAVCSDCEKVEELDAPELMSHLGRLSKMHVRLASRAVIELPVVCSDCYAETTCEQKQASPEGVC